MTIGLLKRISPGNIPRLDEVGIDPTTLLFTFTITLLTGITFGLAPALHSSAPDLNSSLKAGKHGAKQRLRDGFVIAQIAFALVLSIGAGLMVKSFVRLSHEPPGSARGWRWERKPPSCYGWSSAKE